jgi:hypothetical protein
VVGEISGGSGGNDSGGDGTDAARTCCEHLWVTATSPSSWSRDDHGDGGPTIQLPAAEAAAPFQLNVALSIS